MALGPCVTCTLHLNAADVLPRPNINIPEIPLSGFGNFPALIHRFSVDRPIPSSFANSVPLMYPSPMIDFRLPSIPLCRQAEWSFGTPRR